MLGIDEQEIEACRLGQHRHRRPAQMMHAEPDCQLPVADSVQGFACEQRHRLSSRRQRIDKGSVRDHILYTAAS